MLGDYYGIPFSPPFLLSCFLAFLFPNPTPRFDITPQGQQVHVAHGTKDSNIPLSSRHPCFKVASPEALLELRKRVWEAHKAGTEAAPLEADEPGKENSGMFLFALCFCSGGATGRERWVKRGEGRGRRVI